MRKISIEQVVNRILVLADNQVINLPMVIPSQEMLQNPSEAITAVKQHFEYQLQQLPRTFLSSAEINEVMRLFNDFVDNQL